MQHEGGVPVGLALRGGERAVGDGQGAADTQVVVLQMVQPPLGGGQLTGEYVRGERAAGGEAGRDDAQGEREAAGEFDEGVGRVEGAAAGERPQQRGALLVAQGAEREAAGAVEGGQRRTAGDDHCAPGAGRQQRPHLCGVRGVVQDQQRAGRCEQRAQQRGGRVRVFGDAAGLCAEVAEQGGERLGGGERGHAGGGAVQIDVQLTVGETFPQLMGDVQGEGALAYPCHAADDGEGVTAPVEQGPVQVRLFGGAAGEVGWGRRELGRRGWRGG